MELGWTRTEIYNDLYFDEIEDLLNLIKVRKAENYLNLLAIAHNPNTKNPQRLFNNYQQMISKDTKQGVKELKNLLQKSKNISVK